MIEATTVFRLSASLTAPVWEVTTRTLVLPSTESDSIPLNLSGTCTWDLAIIEQLVTAALDRQLIETNVTIAKSLILCLFGHTGMNERKDKAIREEIKKEYDSMGKLTFAEIMVSGMFGLLAILWIFREPPNIPGWGSTYKPKYVNDATPAILVSVLLFLLPAKRPELFCWRNADDPDSKPSYTPILKWDTTVSKLPWGIIILLGGGFALADASSKSGLSDWLGDSLSHFGTYDPWVMNLAFCFIVAIASEVTSNTATATLMVPILGSLAIRVGVHPLYIMISSALSTSFAFMLPVATPPSAIVFSHGYLSIPNMIIRCAYVVIFMSIMWLTEAIPIPATALAPVFLFPMLGVVKGTDIAKYYVSDSTMLFLGGLLLAVAVEEWNLHKRIAVSIIKLIGAHPDMLMIGLMLPTWFLSMWISNTAATAMMVPIITAVTSKVLVLHSQDIVGEDNLGYETDQNSISSNEKSDAVSKEPKPNSDSIPLSLASMNGITKGLSLCVAYAANIGGIATLTGTPPNIVLQSQADESFIAAQKAANVSQVGSGLNFANWMAFGLPLSLLCLVLAYFWLNLCFVRFSCLRQDIRAKKGAIQRVIDDEFNKLGAITFAEVLISICFIILAALWMSRSPPSVGDGEKPKGWGDLFKKGYARDATASILVGVLLFVLPAKLPNVFWWRKNYIGDDEAQKAYKYTPLLSWDAVHKKLPWGVIVLLGGGFALAGASRDSGLSEYIGQELKVFASMEPWVMNLALSLLVAAATEVTSNTATATLLLPIVAELAASMGVNPLYLMMSTAVACSFAFMLPVATPPNAIVFAAGYLRIWHMAGAGLFMNIIAVLVLTLAINTWGTAMFDLDVLPGEFNRTGLEIIKFNCSWPFA
ncbi:hypothetical protein ScPMuIL_007003 [Solemya velum]